MQHETDVAEPSAEDVAVLSLARGSSQSEAAAGAGVHRSTVHRWLQTPEFRERVAAARRDILTQATGKLGDRILAAIDTLADLLKSETETTRLQAARAMLSSLVPLNLQQNLEERLARVEAQQCP